MMVMMTKITGWRKKREGCSPERGKEEIVARFQKYQIDSNSMSTTDEEDILVGIEKRASQ